MRLINDPERSFILLYGAARSGKTALICRYLILTATKYPGVRLLVGRFRFNHAKLSVWMQTLMPMVKQLLPKSAYTENRSDWILHFANGSEIWLGGFDEKDRADKVLSMEFARIAIIEGFQISYDTFQVLMTRCNTEVKDCQTKLIIDGNPRGKRHWIYRVWMLGLNPDGKEPIKQPETYGHLKFRVQDNAHNLSPGYIERNLEGLTGVKRARLLMGDFADMTEGAVYRFDREINHVDTPMDYDPSFPVWCGWDFGIASDVFIVWFQVVGEPGRKGFEIRIIDEYVSNNQSYTHYVTVCRRKPYRNVRYAGDPAGKQRGARLESWFSLLEEQGIAMQSPSEKFSPADMIENSNTMIQYVRICESQCPDMVDMFENWAYPVDKDGAIREGVLPSHDKWSHPGTAFYYATTCAFPPKAERISFR